MHKIDGYGATPDHHFVEGDPTTGRPATRITAAWANALQDEVAGVVEAAGLVLSKDDNLQLLVAVRKLLRVACPVGTVWEGYAAAPPAGSLLLGGQLVSRVTYADLYLHAAGLGLVVDEATWAASAWTMFGAGDGSTTFRLPNLTEEFVTGVGPGRSLAQWQADAIQNITGAFGASSSDSSSLADGSGAFAHDGPASAQWGADPRGPEAGYTFDASRVVRTADRTRPRNVALLRCIYY